MLVFARGTPCYCHRCCKSSETAELDRLSPESLTDSYEDQACNCSAPIAETPLDSALHGNDPPYRTLPTFPPSLGRRVKKDSRSLIPYASTRQAWRERKGGEGQRPTLMVVQPARRRPRTPLTDRADLMTAPQNGETSSDQSAVFMSCGAPPLSSSVPQNTPEYKQALDPFPSPFR